jgi:dTDP-4-dehydrorhamnose 3,5-epimerase
MEVKSLAIPGVRLFKPRRFGDDRGFFVEQYNARVANEVGLIDHFVQDNLSLSRDVGTVRGLHYQSPPMAQAKLVTVLTGAIIDVVVDVRLGSPHYGQHLAVPLDADEGWQIYVPVGFLHGFVTRAADTRVLYKVNAGYSPECDGAVLWNDAQLQINWGVSASSAILSEKDASASTFEAFESPFHYKG